jgi:acyl-CoA dehydrogenase
MNATSGVDESFLTEIRAAAAIAGEHADAVDRDARFPAEAFAALRGSRALGAAVPSQLGGCDVSFGALGNACFELSRRCASSGMVFAMHQIQLASIARHFGQSDFFRTYLADIARNDRLIASVTSEEGTDGDLHHSHASLELLEDGLVRFGKIAPTVSYGAYADDFLVTLRRSPTAEPNDQVLALVHAGQVVLKQTDNWDALGMRGTCSPAFTIGAELSPEQVVPVPFAVIASETMIPYAHILWACCWLGIATDAADRARGYARARRRAASGAEGADMRLSQLSAELSAMRAAVHCATAEYESIKDVPNREELSTLGYAVRINNLKIVASEAARSISGKALEICGVAGYKNGGRFSVGRNVRDALSAPLMIANNRIHAANAQLLLMSDGT